MVKIKELEKQKIKDLEKKYPFIFIFFLKTIN